MKNKLLFTLPLLALSFTGAVQAKDHWRDHSEKEWRREQARQYRYNNNHRGMDRNRDGAIERYEWRGNNRSFRQLDRNGDGVISPADRNRYRNNPYYYNNGNPYYRYNR